MRHLLDIPHPRTTAACLIAAVCVLSAAPSFAGGETALPPTLAQLGAFRGHIEYAAVRLGAAHRQIIMGTFVVRDGGFDLTESVNGSTLHADASGAVLQPGGGHVSDALAAPGLANAYLVIVGRLGVLGVAAKPPMSGDMTLADGTRLYEDPGALHVVGATVAGAPHYAFRFDDWTNENGVLLPRAVVRTRDGAADGVFRIGGYHVMRGTFAGATSPAAAVTPASSVDAAARLVLDPRRFGADRIADAQRPFGSLMLLLALGVLVVAWWRRDGWLDKLCSRAAGDERGWRTIGRSSFVSADGDLFLDGCRYRVGPEFFARSVTVQASPLFVRVSAPGVGKAAVLPRRIAELGKRKLSARQTQAGMSVVEAFVACSLFALVVVGGVFPAVTAAARADAVAQRAALALILARNALDDQESVMQYGAAVSPGSTQTDVEGMHVVTTVTAADGSGVYDVVVRVTDTRGSASAVLGTSIGLPVPTPAPVGAGR